MLFEVSTSFLSHGFLSHGGSCPLFFFGSILSRNDLHGRLWRSVQQSLLDEFHLSMYHHDLSMASCQSLIECPHPCLCSHWLYSHCLPHRLCDLCLDLHPPLFPERPIDRERCSLAFSRCNLCCSHVCKGIQISVGCGIVGLSHVAHHCCQR